MDGIKFLDDSDIKTLFDENAETDAGFTGSSETEKKPEEPVKAIQETKETKTQETKETQTQEQQTVIVKEKVITQYKVAPVEVVVRTKAVSFDQMPQVKVNGVQVPTEQVKTQPTDAKPQILSPNVPVVMEVEEI